MLKTMYLRLVLPRVKRVINECGGFKKLRVFCFVLCCGMLLFGCCFGWVWFVFSFVLLVFLMVRFSIHWPKEEELNSYAVQLHEVMFSCLLMSQSNEAFKLNPNHVQVYCSWANNKTPAQEQGLDDRVLSLT